MLASIWLDVPREAVPALSVEIGLWDEGGQVSVTVHAAKRVWNKKA